MRFQARALRAPSIHGAHAPTSLMPEPATDVAAPRHDKRIADYSRLSFDDISLALTLRDRGLTQTEIAQQLNCSQATVSRCLQAFTDTRQLAKLTLNRGAQALAERVIDKANVEESLEVLDRIGVAEKRQVERGNSQVQVIVAMPGQSKLEPPAIEVQALSPPAFAQPSSDESL